MTCNSTRVPGRTRHLRTSRVWEAASRRRQLCIPARRLWRCRSLFPVGLLSSARHDHFKLPCAFLGSWMLLWTVWPRARLACLHSVLGRSVHQSRTVWSNQVDEQPRSIYGGVTHALAGQAVARRFRRGRPNRARRLLEWRANAPLAPTRNAHFTPRSISPLSARVPFPPSIASRRPTNPAPMSRHSTSSQPGTSTSPVSPPRHGRAWGNSPPPLPPLRHPHRDRGAVVPGSVAGARGRGPPTGRPGAPPAASPRSPT